MTNVLVIGAAGSIARVATDLFLKETDARLTLFLRNARRLKKLESDRVRVVDVVPAAQPTFFANVTISGGPAPVRAYIGELLPDVLEGRIQPGRVFDRVTTLDGVPDGYRAMNEREAIKVMIEF